jgi:hypothetical protein
LGPKQWTGLRLVDPPESATDRKANLSEKQLAFALGLPLSRRPRKTPISRRLLAMLLYRGPSDGLAFALGLSLSRTFFLQEFLARFDMAGTQRPASGGWKRGHAAHGEAPTSKNRYMSACRRHIHDCPKSCRIPVQGSKTPSTTAKVSTTTIANRHICSTAIALADKTSNRS